MPKTVAIVGSFAPSLLNFRGSLIKAMIDRGHRVVCMAPEIETETEAKLAALGAEVRQVDIERAGLNPITRFADLSLAAQGIVRNRTGRGHPLYHQASRVGRPLRRMRSASHE